MYIILCLAAVFTALVEFAGVPSREIPALPPLPIAALKVANANADLNSIAPASVRDLRKFLSGRQDAQPE